MNHKIISIDITPNSDSMFTANGGVMWEHNATCLKFTIAPELVGDYRYYIEYRSLMGTKVRTEYFELNTEDNTVTYAIPVSMSSLKGTECYFNIVAIDEDGNTIQVIKPRKFFLTFDYSPDTDNTLCKVNDFSINSLLEAIRLGTFKGEKGDKGDKGEKGDKGDTGGISEEYATSTFSNALKGSANGDVISMDDVSPIEHNIKVRVHGKNILSLLNEPDIKGTYWSWLIAPNGENVTLSITDKDTSVDVSKIYLGFSGNGYDATDQALWLVTNGVITRTQYSTNKLKYISIYADDKQSAINALLERFNIQVELGATATEYTPYIDPSTVTLKRYGKNLWNGGDITVTDRYAETVLDCVLKAGQTYTFTADVNSNDTDDKRCLVLPNTSATPFYIERGNNKSITFTLEKDATAISLYSSTLASAGEGDTATFKNIQLELSDTATAFEEYKGVEAYTLTTDGNCDVVSVSPAMTLSTDTEGMTIECEYNKDANKIIEKLINAVISLGGTV